MQRLPDSAFEFYHRLGPARSYQAVAEEFGVHKRTVVRAADRENWPARLSEIEKRAQEDVDKKLVNELSDRKLRQRKLVVAIASRAAKGMTDYPITDGMQAIKAAEIAIKLERLLDGEATENTSVDIEQVIRKECRDLLTVEESDEPDPPGVEAED